MIRLVLLLSSAGVLVTAFTCSPEASLQLVSKTRLFSSSDINPSKDDEDELSRLIGKRNEIKRKKRDAEEPIETVEFNISEEDLDWDNLPQFNTERPTRASKKKEEDSAKKKKKDEGTGLDYLADYDDENDFHIPNRIGFTTVAWGDPTRGFVSGGKLTKKMRREGKFVPGDLQVAYNTLLDNGVSFVETSEAYGSASRSSSLSAEHILGRCLEEQKSDTTPLVCATFSNPFPSTRFGGAAVVKAMENSNTRMGITGVELLQIQSTFLYAGGRGALAAGLAQAIDKGYCNYVGGCNLGKGGIRGFAKKLEARGLTLTSNQFEFSLTKRKAWKSGLIDYCKEMGVIPLVRNPLDGGLASGRYTATNPSGGEAGGTGKYSFSMLEKLQPLHSVQETVAERASTRVKRETQDLKERYRRSGPGPKINSDITTTQVAINYVIAKGAVPICDVTDGRQAEEILGCLGWGLSEDEVEMLDSAAALCDL